MEDLYNEQYWVSIITNDRYHYYYDHDHDYTTTITISKSNNKNKNDSKRENVTSAKKK